MSFFNKNTTLAKTVTVLTVIVAIITAITFSHYMFGDNVHLVEQKEARGTVHVLDYSEAIIENESAPLGVQRICTMTSSELTDGSECLAFFAIHQFVDVYVDNELVYSLKKADICNIGKTAGTNWINVSLDHQDSGKEIKVVLTPVYEDVIDMEMEFLEGPQLEIILDQLQSDWYEIVLSVLSMFIGVIFIIISGFYFRTKQTGGYLTALGCFAIMIGIWKFTDIGLCFILWPDKTILFFYTSISMLMFLPIPLLKGMKSFFDEKLHKGLDLFSAISVAVAALLILLQLLGVSDLRENLGTIHFFIIADAVLGGICFIYEKVVIKRKGNVGIGRVLFVLCAVGAIMDLTMYYVKGTSFGLIFTLLAFFVYVVVIGFELAFDYFRKQNELLEKEVELSDRRIDLMVSQIQPHFLYNVISSIMGICMQSSEKAMWALSDFADYLRGNLDSLQSEKMIPFAKELHHVESYLRLEKLRFAERLNIYYDLEVQDFMIPTLAVQPLVENAVKHGIGQKEEGGMVKLVTRELGDHILIVVEDTGIGFDPEIKKHDGRSHLGLENVKRRVAMMSKGEMEIQSQPGEGTRISIRIPKVI